MCKLRACLVGLVALVCAACAPLAHRQGVEAATDGDYLRARALLTQALEQPASGAQRLNTLVSLANVEALLGELDAADAHLEQALALDAAQGMARLQVITALAALRFNQRRYGEARHLLEGIEVPAAGAGSAALAADKATLEGAIFRQEERYAEAERRYREASAIAARHGLRERAARAQLFVAELAVRDTDADDADIGAAIDDVRAALAVLSGLRSPTNEAYTAIAYNYLGELHLRARRPDESRVALTEARQRFDRLAYPEGVARTWLREGQLLLQQGQYTQAEKAFTRSIDRFHSLSDTDWIRLAYIGLGHVREALGDTNGAIDHYKQAVEYQEKLESLFFASEEALAVFRRFNFTAYERLVTLLFDRGEIAEAFRYAQKDQAHEYLKRLLEAAGGLQYRGGGAGESVSAMIRSEEARSAVLLRGYTDFLLGYPHLVQEHARLQTLRDAQEQVTRSFPPNTAVLAYYMTQTRLLIFFVAKDEARFLGVAADKPLLELRRDITNLYGLLRSFAPETKVVAALDEMSGTLLTLPGVDLSSYAHLLVIPDDYLHYIPFEALRIDTPNGREYLIEEIGISYPVIETLGTSVGKLHARGGSLQTATAAAFAREDFTNVAGMDNLRFARDEAQEVVAAMGGTLHVEPGTANEPSFRKAFGQHEILHIATHMRMRSDGARLLLWPGPNPGEESEDGELTVTDFIRLRSELGKLKLITLSACGTALSLDFYQNPSAVRKDREFSVNSLAYGATSTGVDTFIANNWRLDDQFSLLFMKRFYTQARLESMSMYAAFRQTISYFATSDSQYRHPHFWAVLRYYGALL